MQKQWFVLHVLSGHEKKVCESIESRVDQEDMREYIGELLVPTETVAEMRRGKRVKRERKFFPGYILANIALYKGEKELNERTWHFINGTQGVIGFVGGNCPSPLRPDEINAITGSGEEKKETVRAEIKFDVGETVKINDGPFLNFTGVIDEVDAERGKLKISVAIFGRTAPVELEYWQVEET